MLVQILALSIASLFCFAIAVSSLLLVLDGALRCIDSRVRHAEETPGGTVYWEFGASQNPDSWTPVIVAAIPMCVAVYGVNAALAHLAMILG